MPNILLTSAGGLTGTYLIKHFQRSCKENKIIAVDVNDLVPAKILADKFYCVPYLTDAEIYKSAISEIVSNNNIEYIIPITSKDMDFYSTNTEWLDDINLKYCIVDKETNEKLSNKIQCNYLLSSFGLDVPKIYSSIKDIANYPILYKPINGSGSKGQIIINNLDELSFYEKNKSGGFYMQFIYGEEYTVDCLFGLDGKCVGFNNRVRLKTVSGGATICVNKYDKKVENIIRVLEGYAKLRGAINFQYLKGSDDKLYIIDFNTRFASGGLPLTVKTGFDIPNKLIELMKHGKTSNWKCGSEAEGLTMIRYYDELFY